MKRSQVRPDSTRQGEGKGGREEELTASVKVGSVGQPGACEEEQREKRSVQKGKGETKLQRALRRQGNEQ